MTEEKRQALREAMEAQQALNKAVKVRDRARKEAGLPEWDHD